MRQTSRSCLIGFVVAVLLLMGIGPVTPALAAQTEPVSAVRTIMLYLCGSDLETNHAVATHNLHQILEANFSADEDVRFVVMTGGANAWHLEGEYLASGTGDPAPTQISAEYNQVWEAKGADAPEGQNPGKLVLLDGDGITGDGAEAKASDQELMSDPKTLTAFIDYCAQNYPAQKYDLILWNHGGGPASGFGIDAHGMGMGMSCAGLADAFSNNAVTRSGGKFDFINFDACLMGNIECALLFADYADYYIASPEVVPGDGESYTGWLNSVGETPDINAYTLGKQIVDDLVEYYEAPARAGQRATMAVTDTQKLLDSGLTEALLELSSRLDDSLLATNAEGERAFYDELRSAFASLEYGNTTYYDLGNFTQLLGASLYEATLDDTGNVNTKNAYTALVGKIMGVLDDEGITYSRSTDNLVAGPEFHRLADGTTTFGRLYPSSFSISFPLPAELMSCTMYLEAITDVAKQMPDGARKQFVQKLTEVYAKYAYMYTLGSYVGSSIAEGAERDAVTYETLNQYGMGAAPAYGGSTRWDALRPVYEQVFFTRLDKDAQAEVSQWVEPIVRQQAKEAVSKQDVSSRDVKWPDGTGREITIDNTHKRIIASVDEDVSLVLPSVDAYLEQHPDEKALVSTLPVSRRGIVIGTHTGLPFDDSTSAAGIEDFNKHYLEWLNSNTSIWQIMPSENSWYALKDASGNLHVVAVGEGRTPDELVATTMLTDGEGRRKSCFFMFKKEVDGIGPLSEMLVFPDERITTFRSMLPEELEGTFSVMSNLPLSVPVSTWDQQLVNLPLSKSAFDISSETAGGVELVYVPVEQLADVADDPEGGKQLTKSYSVKDIYGTVIDITEQVDEGSKGDVLTSIEFAEMAPATYTGAPQRPQVTLDGKRLVEGKDYGIIAGLDGDVFEDAGSYEVILHGKGEYRGAQVVTFTIAPAPISDATIAGIEDKAYTGRPATQELVLTFAGKTLVEGKDYTLAYQNNVEVGTATVVITGLGNFAGSMDKTFRISDKQVVPIATYAFTAGANATWTKGGTSALGFTVKRSVADDQTFGRFKGVAVDGKELAASSYDTKAGSLVLSMKPAYLETLSVGSHDVVVRFDDGTATTRFSVADAAAQSTVNPGSQRSTTTTTATTSAQGSTAAKSALAQTSDAMPGAAGVALCAVALLAAGVRFRRTDASV